MIVIEERNLEECTYLFILGNGYLKLIFSRILNRWCIDKIERQEK